MASESEPRLAARLGRRRFIALAAAATMTAIGAACVPRVNTPDQTATPDDASAPAPSSPTPTTAGDTPRPADTPTPVLPPSVAAPTATATPRQAEANGRVTIGTNQAPLEEPWFAKALAGFSARYPRVTLEQWNVREKYLESVATWAAAGKLPEVLYTQLRHAGALSYRKWVLSIDELVRRDSSEVEPDDFYAPLAREARVAGKWMALPHDDSVGVIYCDVGALAAANKLRPADDWTWADLASLARDTTQTLRDGQKARWGFRWRPEVWALPALWRSFGGGFAKDERSIRISTEPHVQALQWLGDLMASGHAARPADLAPEAIGMASGRVVAEAGGSWSLARFHGMPATVRYDVLLFPKTQTAPRGSYSTGSGWCLTRDSRNQSAAWEVMKHLSSRDTMELTTALPLRNLPGRASATPLWMAGVKALGMPERREVFAVAASEAHTLEPVPWWLEFADACDAALGPFLEGRAKPTEALAEIEQRTNAAAARYA